jgi:GNAT superfamily N-acetyltransferase
MDQLVVRPAQPGDGDDLARGWIETGRYYAALDPQAYQVPEAEGLAAWFETLRGKARSKERIWLVAEVAGRVIGNVEAHLEQPVDSAPRQLLRHLGERRVIVDAVGVEEAYRRRGVAATRLMQAVEGWAREQGAILLLLETDLASALSMPFYERRMAYQKRAVIFQKRLG